MKLGFLIAILVVVGVIGGILLGSNSDTNQTTQNTNSVEKSAEIIKSSSANPINKANCDKSYPSVCIPPYPPDLDCGEIQYSNFRVIGADRHGFDQDNDGIGCES